MINVVSNIIQIVNQSRTIILLDWILKENVWDDDGSWFDNEIWND